MTVFRQPPAMPKGLLRFLYFSLLSPNAVVMEHVSLLVPYYNSISGFYGDIFTAHRGTGVMGGDHGRICGSLSRPHPGSRTLGRLGRHARDYLHRERVSVRQGAAPRRAGPGPQGQDGCVPGFRRRLHPILRLLLQRRACRPCALYSRSPYLFNRREPPS